jgi:hypothetical protein
MIPTTTVKILAGKMAFGEFAQAAIPDGRPNTPEPTKHFKRLIISLVMVAVPADETVCSVDFCTERFFFDDGAAAPPRVRWIMSLFLAVTELLGEAIDPSTFMDSNSMPFNRIIANRRILMTIMVDNFL